ncbi:MAG: hypothetical protein L3V56_05555 [Candidatus Magnetoovum sp. WYHC-5]|nr:hypothetical protein [Candidatus Magnetoovum sp. WYHC-5]
MSLGFIKKRFSSWKVDILMIFIITIVTTMIIKDIEKSSKVEVSEPQKALEIQKNPATILKDALNRQYSTIEKKAIFFPDGIYPEDKPAPPTPTPTPEQVPSGQAAAPSITPTPVPISNYKLLGTILGQESTAILVDDKGTIFKVKDGSNINDTTVEGIHDVSVTLKHGSVENILKIFQIKNKDKDKK